MLVPQVRCNLCRCHIDSDGERLLGGIGLLHTFKPPHQTYFQVAKHPLDQDARIHICTQCLNAIKKLTVEPA